MKRYLMTPGPTSVPPEVLLAGAVPVVHHRSPDYRPIFKNVCEGLKYVFQTKNPVITITSSGTGAMEGAVASTLSPGDKALAVRAGKFGERWGELCKAYGAETAIIDIEWGGVVDPETIKEHLEKNPDTKAVLVTHCETSTGVLTDVKTIGNIVRNTAAILVVDAISSLGAEELRPDEWDIDIVVAGSQKALMMPPGLSFASVSPKAQKLIAKSKCPKYYFSYANYLKSLEKNNTPFTPAVSLTLALEKSLELIKNESIENIWKRHANLARAIRAGAESMGLEIFSRSFSNVVTALRVPEGIDGSEISKMLRDEYGVTIAGGQEHLEGKIFRIATLGYAETFDVIICISALELTLERLGHKFDFGSGVRAALKVLGE